tara:strand:+ start:1339 stop:1479 length:141 start_codon:yes stop_codon:yes gene_type:complete
MLRKRESFLTTTTSKNTLEGKAPAEFKKNEVLPLINPTPVAVMREP